MSRRKLINNEAERIVLLTGMRSPNSGVFDGFRYGSLRVKARDVSIRGMVTSSVIEGERYRTTGQAHITYSGSTGGEVSEIRRFEAELEEGKIEPHVISFREVKNTR